MPDCALEKCIQMKFSCLVDKQQTEWISDAAESARKPWVRVIHNNKPASHHRSPRVSTTKFESLNRDACAASRESFRTESYEYETVFNRSRFAMQFREIGVEWRTAQLNLLTNSRSQTSQFYVFFLRVFPRFNSVPRLNFNVLQKMCDWYIFYYCPVKMQFTYFCN